MPPFIPLVIERIGQCWSDPAKRAHECSALAIERIDQCSCVNVMHVDAMEAHVDIDFVRGPAQRPHSNRCLIVTDTDFATQFGTIRSSPVGYGSALVRESQRKLVWIDKRSLKSHPRQCLMCLSFTTVITRHFLTLPLPPLVHWRWPFGRVAKRSEEGRAQKSAHRNPLLPSSPGGEIRFLG